MIDKLKTMVERIKPSGDGAPIASMFLESETNGFLPFNTASIRIKAFYDSSKSERIGNVSYKWFREFEGRNYAIDNIEEFHNVSCEDIGSKIIVIVNDNDRPGVHASLVFGPIILDPQVRTELETSLGSGRATFEVQYPYKSIGNESLTKPNLIKNPEQIVIDELNVSDTTITLLHSKGNSSAFQLSDIRIEPLENFPLVVKVRIDEFSKDLDFFEIRTDEAHPYFYIKFFNRVFREHFLLLTKLFREIKQLPYMLAIEELKKKSQQKSIFSVKLSNVLGGNQALGDMLIQSSILKETLGKNVMYTKSVIEEKDALTAYCQSLETDLQSTLKELKNLVEKKNLHDQVDLPRIKKVESSMIQIKQDREKAKADNSFQNLAPESFRNIRNEKLKDDNEKLQKLNKMLMKELNTYREKKKEKLKMINQSLNNLQREVQGQASHLEIVANQSMDVSKYLDNYQTGQAGQKKPPSQNFLDELKAAGAPMNFKKNQGGEGVATQPPGPGFGKGAGQAPGQAAEDFALERQQLQAQVIGLNKEIEGLKAIVADKSSADPEFKELMDKIDQTVNNDLATLTKKVQNLVDDLGHGHPAEHPNDSLPQRVLTARNRLLTLENDFLKAIIDGVMEILRVSQGVNSLSVSQSLEMKTANRLFDDFRSTVQKMNEELDDVHQQAQEQRHDSFHEENPLVKQNIVMKSEIEKLKNENEVIRTKTVENLEAEASKRLDSVVAEKDRIIQQLTMSNANLAAEIQNLQAMLNQQHED